MTLQDQQRLAKALARMDVRHVCTLHVTRHGETDWNKEHRLQGQLDPDLNDTGRAQAMQLAEHFAGSHLDAIYSSDLKRAVHTAHAIAEGKSMQVVQRAGLRERHLGELQGLTRQEAAVKCPQAWAALQVDSQRPGTLLEGRDVLRKRVTAEVEAIAVAHPGQTVLLVVHGGVIHALLDNAAGSTARKAVVNGSIHTLKVQGRCWALVEGLNPCREGGAGGFGGGVAEG
ncbi:phosphoglycerate mutase [Haematococcus lacustris]